MKTTKETILEPVLMVDSHHGIYGPKIFLETLAPKLKKQIPKYITETLKKGPNYQKSLMDDDYWDVWNEVTNIQFKHNNQKLYVEERDGDIFLIPACFYRTKEYKENWVW